MMETCKYDQMIFKKKIKTNLPSFNFHTTGPVKSNLELFNSVQRHFEI